MNRKALIVVSAVVILVLGACAYSYAADQKTAAKAAQGVPDAAQAAPVQYNFGMVSGAVLSVDNSDPASVKLSVKNDADGTTKTVVVTPTTNITKTTDVSEIKSGEQIRVMARKVDDNYVAMGIMFGKMQSMPTPAAPATPAMPVPAAQKAKK